MSFTNHSYGLNDPRAAAGAVPGALLSYGPHTRIAGEAIQVLTSQQADLQGKITALQPIAPPAALLAAAVPLTALEAMRTTVVALQSDSFRRELNVVRRLYGYLADSAQTMDTVSVLRSLIIPADMFTPAFLQQGIAHQHGACCAAPAFGQDVPALAFFGRIRQTTTGNIICLDAQNFHLYLPGGANRGAITAHLRVITDRINGQEVPLNQWFSDLPEMCIASYTNFLLAKADISKLATEHSALALIEQELVNYHAKLTAAAAKAEAAETIHNAMLAIKAYVDDALEYLAKNSRVS